MTFKIASIDKNTGEVAYFDYPVITILELNVGNVMRKFVVHEGKGSQIGQTILSDFKTGFGVKPFGPYIVEMLEEGNDGADDVRKVGQYIIDRLVHAIGSDAVIDKMDRLPVINFEN